MTQVSLLEPNIGSPSCVLSACKRYREALEAVKKEGDSRAAEMRERCAVRAGDAAGLNWLTETIRALLTEAKDNG